MMTPEHITQIKEEEAVLGATPEDSLDAATAVSPPKRSRMRHGPARNSHCRASMHTETGNEILYIGVQLFRLGNSYGLFGEYCRRMDGRL